MTDEVAIAIDGKEFRYWSGVEITLSLDTFSTLEFRAPFEADRFEFRDAFRPFKFRPLTATIDGELFFTGTTINISPSTDPDSSDMVCSGYSAPGVLANCKMPGSSLPLEFRKLNFEQILGAICVPFALGIDVRADVGPVFDKVALDVDDAPMNVLADLAKQRSIVLSSTEYGHVLVWKSITNSDPVAEFAGQPVGTVRPTYNAEDYFSEVTGFCPARRKKKGSKFTRPNPWLRDRIRPTSFKMDDTEKGDAETAVNARLGRMFANVMGLTISDIPTWRDPQGDVWAPNTMVSVHEPNAMIYSPTKFLVRDVRLMEDAGKKTAELNLVLPGAFSGEIPSQLPWDEPSNADDPYAAYEATLR